MQQITISGTLLSDVEKGTDKNGRTFLRFTVSCGWNDQDNRTQYTHYRCTCYVGGYEKLKKGDQVFVTGKLTATIGYDDDRNAFLNMDVMVYQINRGYRAVERATRS